MQLVRSWQWVIHGEWVRQSRDRFIQQVEDHTLNRPPQWFRQGLDLPARTSQESGPDGRSIADAPRLGKLTARERRRVVTGTRITLDARLSHRPADLTPQAANLSPQRVQLSAGDRHHLGCFGAHMPLPPLDAAPPSLG
jgi:hypothetical protein